MFKPHAGAVLDALQMLTHRVPTTLCHGWDHELTLSMRRQAPGNQVADLN